MVGRKRFNSDEGENSNSKKKSPKGVVGEDATKEGVSAIKKLINGQQSSSKRNTEVSSDSDSRDSRFKFKKNQDYRTPSKKDLKEDLLKKPKKNGRKTSTKDATDDDESVDEGHKRSTVLLARERLENKKAKHSEFKKGTLKQKTVQIALDLGTKNKELRAEIHELKKEIKVKSEKTEVKPTADDKKLGEDNARLRKKREDLEKEVDANKSTLRRVRRERDEAKDEVDKGKKEVSNLVQEVRTLRRQHNEECFSQEEKYMLEMRIDELEEEKRGLEEGSDEGDDVSKFKKDVEDLESKKKAFIKEIEEMDAERIKLQLAVEELKENGMEKVDDSSEVLELKDRIARVTKKAIRDCNELGKENKELRNLMEELKAKLILTQENAKKDMKELGIEVEQETFNTEGVESQSLFGDSRILTEDDEDGKDVEEGEEEEMQAKSVLHETANMEDMSTDDEFDSRAATFLVGDYKVRNIKSFKESMVRNAKFPEAVQEASKRFTPCTLNNKIMFIVISSTARGTHTPKPKMGASFCNLAPVCGRKFVDGDDIAMVYVFGCIFHAANMTEVWVCGHHADCSVEGYEMQIQTRNRNCEGPPGVKGVKAVDKADNKEGDDKKVKGARDTKNNQEKITKK